MNTLSISFFTFTVKKLYGSHTIYDVLPSQTDVNGLYVNCHQVAAFLHLSRQDPITVDSGNMGALPAKVIAANA